MLVDSLLQGPGVLRLENFQNSGSRPQCAYCPDEVEPTGENSQYMVNHCHNLALLNTNVKTQAHRHGSHEDKFHDKINPH